MKARIAAFSRRDDGGATVETVLWLPLLFAVFGLMLDVAMVFNGQAKVLRVIQDYNREFSIGGYGDPNEPVSVELARMQADMKKELNALELWPSTIAPSVSSGVIRTTVVIPARQLTITHFFGALASLEVDVTADMTIENWES